MFSALLNGISSLPWKIIADVAPEPWETATATDVTTGEIFTYGSVALLAVVAAAAIIFLLIRNKKTAPDKEDKSNDLHRT